MRERDGVQVATSRYISTPAAVVGCESESVPPGDLARKQLAGKIRAARHLLDADVGGRHAQRDAGRRAERTERIVRGDEERPGRDQRR